MRDQLILESHVMAMILGVVFLLALIGYAWFEFYSFNKKKTNTQEPTWRDLKKFIDEKVKEHGNSWLDNQLYIEMVSPKEVNQSYKVIQDGDGWSYVQPCWYQTKNQTEAHVLATTFTKKGIVTLNINF